MTESARFEAFGSRSSVGFGCPGHGIERMLGGLGAVKVLGRNRPIRDLSAVFRIARLGDARRSQPGDRIWPKPGN
jgi:hypothetical protein